MMDLMVKDKVFGKNCCYMFSIKRQKHGLPHAHILIWLCDSIRLTDIDAVVSAEIPCKESDPLLLQVVTTNMVDGLCGNLNLNLPCMKDRCCGKSFPNKFVEKTQTAQDGYPLNKRRGPEKGG